MFKDVYSILYTKKIVILTIPKAEAKTTKRKLIFGKYYFIIKNKESTQAYSNPKANDIFNSIAEN